MKIGGRYNYFHRFRTHDIDRLDSKLGVNTCLTRKSEVDRLRQYYAIISNLEPSSILTGSGSEKGWILHAP